MKKNKLFLLGLFVVFAAVLSLSLVSNTLAKYTSNGTGTDSARVAKWGVTVTVTGNNAFAEKYAKDDESFTLDANTVVSAVKVLAPGTEGTLGSVTISGTPEVAVELQVTLQLTLTGWEVGGDFYCPIIFSDGTNTVNGTDYDNVGDLKEAVEDLVNQAATKYKAGTDLSGEYGTKTITWEWAFETGADAATKEANNAKDKLLGDAATATIEAVWNASVTQIN